MTIADLIKEAIIEMIVRDYPKAFWEDLRAAFRQGYVDVFHQVHADPNLLAEQRIDALYQARHFRMEYLLQTIAGRHGVASSPTILVSNHRRYVFTSKGSVAFTQAYIPAIGDMPKPARFRERHAQMNEIGRHLRLFDDEPREVTLPKAFYAILTHNPRGTRFDEEHQKLGMLQLCVPNADCTRWESELTIEEIVAAYVEEKLVSKTMREMQWKETKKKEEGEG